MTRKKRDNVMKAERLYHDYRRLMYQAAYEILQDHALSEDAVSESFVRIMKNLHKIEEENCPRTRSFLVIICRNVAKDIYKTRGCLPLEEEQMEKQIGREERSRNPEDILISKESIERMTKAIQQLEPIYRDVFLLKRVHGFSREEIAELFHISVETVKKRLSRAKDKIIENMQKEESIHE